MNKYLYWKRKKIITKIEYFQNKFNFKIQFVECLNANGCVINYEKKYFLFINKETNVNLLPLIIFHEIGHIKQNTIVNDPKKYIYFNEVKANLFAINNLKCIFNLLTYLELIILAIFSEKRLYKFFLKRNYIGGEFLYELN